MTHTLRTISTVNLAFAVLAATGYCIAGHLFRLPVHARFLAIGPAYPSGTVESRIDAWITVMAVVWGLVVVFGCLRYAERAMHGHRALCAIFALAGFFGLFLYSLPRFVDDSLSDGFLRLDRTLAWYVWGSHLAYAIMGPNED